MTDYTNPESDKIVYTNTESSGKIVYTNTESGKIVLASRNAAFEIQRLTELLQVKDALIAEMQTEIKLMRVEIKFLKSGGIQPARTGAQNE